jgi:hypothetical protein
MFGKFHPPSGLGRWSVVMGTRKIYAGHMYQVQVEVSCWTCIRVGSSICVMNQIFVTRLTLTYCFRCSRHTSSVLANDFLAWARTARIIRDQLSALDSAMVWPKLTPRISIRILNWVSRGVVGSARPAIANALKSGDLISPLWPVRMC